MHPLMKALISNRVRSASPLRVVNKAGEPAKLYIYDVIGEWFGGITAKDVVTFMASLAGDEELHIHWNSPGGDVFEGRAIATAIAAHKGKTVSFIDGIAASAASWGALAAKEVKIAKGAFLMIHNSSTFAWGDKHDMKKTGETLDKLDQTFVRDYADKTGQKPEQLQAWMDEETWFDDQEAISNGFADAAYEPADEEKVSNVYDLSGFRNAPKPKHTPPPAADPKTPPENNDAPTEDADYGYRARRVRCA